MYSIRYQPLKGKWKVEGPNNLVVGDNYSSAIKAAEKLVKYLKGQS